MLAEEELDELLLDPVKLAKVIEKRRTEIQATKQQQGNGDNGSGATDHEVELLDELARSLGKNRIQASLNPFHISWTDSSTWSTQRRIENLRTGSIATDDDGSQM